MNAANVMKAAKGMDYPPYVESDRGRWVMEMVAGDLLRKWRRLVNARLKLLRLGRDRGGDGSESYFTRSMRLWKFAEPVWVEMKRRYREEMGMVGNENRKAA